MENNEKITIEELKELGFSDVADELIARKEFDRKCMIAYEHFRYVTPEHIKKHNEKLKANSLKTTGTEGKNLYHHYDRLKFTPIKNYAKVPPRGALAKLKEAKERGCFDDFQVCSIESVKKYKDPIIFGVIKECADIFFICQWDNDVKIEDILKESEG